MIVTLAPDVPDSTRSAIADAAALIGSSARELTWEDGIRVVAIDGDLHADALRLPGVVASHDKHKNYMLASKLVRERSTVRVGEVEIGSGHPVIMAGPSIRFESTPMRYEGGAPRLGADTDEVLRRFGATSGA